MTFLPLLGIAAALASGPVAQTTASPPVPSPAPLVSPTPIPSGLLPSATPSGIVPSPAAATPSSAASALPAPAASAVPAIAPGAVATLPPSAYTYRFVPGQPAKLTPGQPQIFAVYLNAKRLRSHGKILIRVETNADVVKMESRNGGRGGAIPMTAPGVFAAQSSLPTIPFIASGVTTDLIFTGTSADGRTVVVRVPIQVG